MLRVEVVQHPPPTNYPHLDHERSRTIDLGRAGAVPPKGVSFHPCGNQRWLSRRAATFVSDGQRWWLTNPSSRTAIQYRADDLTSEIHLTVGGSCLLPDGRGRIWLSSSAAGEAIEVEVDVKESILPESVTGVLATKPPPRATESLSPQKGETLDILAVATWHRRRRTAFRCLRQVEVASYLGISQKTVADRISSYRKDLEDAGGVGVRLSEQTQAYLELCGLVMDYGLIGPDVDASLLHRFVEPPPIC